MSQMNLISQTKIAVKKIRAQNLKSLLVILPIALLVIVVVLLTSEAFSIIRAVEGSVFVALENESKVIQLTKASNNPGGRFLSRFGGSETSPQVDYYTSDDQTKIQNISGVSGTQLVATVPVKPVVIQSIGGTSNITINNLSSLDADSAKLYTTENFTYSGNQPIPIILSSNDLQETYEDWQGKDSITVNLGNAFARRNSAGTPNGQTNPGQQLQQANPVKTRALNIDPAQLLGQTINVNIGGLSKIPDYSTSNAQGSVTFTKLSDTDYQTKQTDRQNSISAYWDYNKINTPQTYQFKIVGITQGSDKTRTYIPQDFTDTLIKNYLANEQSARNSTPLPQDQFSNFSGLTFDGTSLFYDQFAGLSAQINRSNNTNQQALQDGQNAQNTANSARIRNTQIPDFNRNRVQIGQTNSNFIPGLVYQQDPASQSLTGEYAGFSGADYPLQAQTILVKLQNPEVRSNVVQQLNSNGYTFQDQDRLAEINKLKTDLQNDVYLAISIAAVIVGLLVLFAMSRFVSDSRREIGIYRALGATRNTVRSLIVLQTMVLTLIGYVLGAALGAGAVYLASGYLSGNIKSLINQIVGNQLPIPGKFTAQDFQHFDLSQIAVLLVVMVLMMLAISLIPAQSAARTSPIQAIRD